MPAQRQIFTACLSFPNQQSTTSIGSGQQHAIRAELKRINPVRMLLAFVSQFTSGSAVDTHNFLRTAEGNQSLISTNVGSQNFVEFIADRHDSFASADIPDNAETLRSTSTTTRQQKSAVAAEL